MGEERPDRSAVPDAEIVQLVLGGEMAAFDEIVRRTRRSAYRLARRITRNHEDADDDFYTSQNDAACSLHHLQQGIIGSSPPLLRCCPGSDIHEVHAHTTELNQDTENPRHQEGR